MSRTDEQLTAPPLVSIVTPFFNTAEYLAECIESVLSQSYQSFEYILLDNCSTDESSRIARAYAEKDRRIRLVTATEFVGQVENYNRALQYISPDSRYTKIVQADDWIFENCVSEMVSLAESDPSVGVVGSYSLYRNHVGHDVLPFRKGGIFAGTEAIRHYLLDEGGFLGSPTCVMYRSALVRTHQPFFSDKSPCEDVDICMDLLHGASLGFVFQVLTYNRRDNDGIWTRIQGFDPVVLNDLFLVHKHGPVALDHDTFSVRLRQVERNYYARLARALFRGDVSGLLRYHRLGLATLGLSIDWWRLSAAVVRQLIDFLGNPKRSAGDLRRYLQRRTKSSKVK